jgi:hypothetical protein
VIRYLSLLHHGLSLSSAFIHAKSTELKLSNIRSLALHSYYFYHYLISRQLFQGWNEDPPSLTGLEELIIVFRENGYHGMRVAQNRGGTQERRANIEKELRKKLGTKMQYEKTTKGQSYDGRGVALFRVLVNRTSTRALS